MESSTIDSMCRCCAAEGIFKDIKTSYHWMGEEEVYGDMLQECFDVKLATIEEGGICEVCITQLRNAANFKKQVLHTERKFKRHLESRRFKPTEVKEELSGDNGNSSDDNDRGADDTEEDEDYVPEFEIPIKTESAEETKSRKRTAKASSSRAKKSRIAVEEKSKLTIKKEIFLTEIKEEPRTGEDSCKSEIKIKLVKVLHDTKAPNSIAYKKLQHNLRQIIQNSNATPIRRVNDLDYVCAYCDYQHPIPDELKNHTIATHSKETVITSTKKMCAYDLLVKLDISSLRCKLCNHNLETLEQLLEHLQTSHSRKIHTDIPNQILPFKFGDGPLSCFICNATFANFKVLNVHVNTHYRHYVCKICGVGFVNPNKLGLHMLTHKTGSFVCSHCFKEFPTNVKKMAHEKQVHGTKLRLKCWHCDERFADILVKEKHMTEAHGIVFPTPKCETCDKVFLHRKSLNSHMKRVHLVDRRHECSQCEMKFYAPSGLRNHMLKHTGDRQFKCEVCHKGYSRKNTLREHMRIHTNDRRFKCEHCGMTFVQKCSWRSHMRNKHGDIA